MASSNGIKEKISNIESTSKITRVMELISVSKLRKSRKILNDSEFYFNSILRILHSVSKKPLYKDDLFFRKRSIKSIGHLVISTDRGLCGSLNSSLFKSVHKSADLYCKLNIKVHLFLVGFKAKNFFKSSSGVKVVFSSDFSKLLNSANNINILARNIFNYFIQHKIDAFQLFGNNFISTTKQKVINRRILPFLTKENNIDNLEKWDYIYESDPRNTLNQIFLNYLKSTIYRSLLDNEMCEHAARMLAMKNSTDNANDIIKQLKLDYNKLRQARITQELAEIVSGSSAI